MKILTALTCLICLLQFATTTIAQVPPGMKNYTFVMLKKGGNRTQDSLTVIKIQKDHLDYISKMGEEHDLSIAGPFLDDGDWRGILIFDTADTNKVKSLVEQDPAVKSGRLSYEIHPWMAKSGSVLK